MTEPYRNLGQRPYESIYLHAQTTIERRIEEVWPHALNIGGWMNAHGLEPLAGEVGRVGRFERVYPKGLGEEVGQPHYHLYGIAEIIPLKLIALEVLPEKGGSYGNTREWMSFDSILFDDVDGKTRITFLMVDVHMGQGNADFHARRTAELEAARSMLEDYFVNLRKLVDSAG